MKQAFTESQIDCDSKLNENSKYNTNEVLSLILDFYKEKKGQNLNLYFKRLNILFKSLLYK